MTDQSDHLLACRWDGSTVEALGSLGGTRGCIADVISNAGLIAGKIAFLRQKSFIEAAHALGLPARAVILKHILWLNCRALLVIQATLGMAEAILVETSLSYLGFGVQEPTPSWGNMVQAGANYFLQGNFWPSTAPALAILATILGFQLLGDGLNKLLEGRRRR
jgi:ABC-type dipeptide/oligopeptide/nickel transport system permease subunit